MFKSDGQKSESHVISALEVDGSIHKDWRGTAPRTWTWIPLKMRARNQDARQLHAITLMGTHVENGKRSLA